MFVGILWQNDEFEIRVHSSRQYDKKSGRYERFQNIAMTDILNTLDGILKYLNLKVHH